MTVKKMSVNVAKTSKKSRLPVSTLLPRIAIYSAVMAGLMASYYDFQLNTIVLPWYRSMNETFLEEATFYIKSINEAQQDYYAEYGQFSDSIAKLSLRRMKKETNDYNYTILSSMGPVQTGRNPRKLAEFESAIASAKPTDRRLGKSYTGAVFAYKEKGSNVIRTISAICQSDRDNATYEETWSPPTFDGKKISCQSGTTLCKEIYCQPER